MSQDSPTAEPLPELDTDDDSDLEPSREWDAATVLSFGRTCLGLMFLGAILWIVFLDPRTAEPPPWTGWTLRDVLLIFLAWHSLGGLAHMAWYFATHENELVRNHSFHPLTINLGNAIGEVLAMLLAMGVFGLQVRGQGWEAVGLVPMSATWLLITLGVGLAIGPLMIMTVLVGYRGSGTAFESDQLDYILPPRVPTSGKPLAPGVYGVGVLFMVLLAGGVAPLAEEILFRGILYPWLADWLGVIAAIVISSALFGLVHLTWGASVATANGIIGLVLVLMYYSSGSLWSAVLIHMLLNSSRFLLAAASHAGWFRQPLNPSEPETSPAPPTIPSEDKG